MFKVAIVGMGGMGKTHFNNLKKMPHVMIDAICDPNPSVAALADEINAAYFTCLEEMLAVTAASTVLVFTPTFLHAQQIRAVLESGRHCIAEKPLCLKAQDAKLLFALALKKKVHLYVAHVLHFFRGYAILAEIIRSKRYGKVIDGVFCRLTEKPKWITGNWLFDKSKSGLIPYDLHIHELEFIISLFGKPSCAQRQAPADERRQPSHYRFLYTYPDFTICAEASWYHAPIPFTQTYRVYFESAVVIMEADEILISEAGKSVERLSLKDDAEIDGTEINTASALPYYQEIEHFLRCIDEDRDSDIVQNETVADVLEILEQLG